jgi:uncharacterized protein YtpQ (UPF0354 family)
MTEQEYINNAIDFLNGKFNNIRFTHDSNLMIKADKDGGIRFNLEDVFKKSSQNNFVNWQNDLYELALRVFNIASEEIKVRSNNPNYMSLDNIKTKIFPLIKDKAFIDNSKKSFMNEKGVIDESITLVYKPFLLDLYICWGVDIGAGYEYLRKKDLVSFGISIDELDNISRENLEDSPQTQKIAKLNNPDTQVVEAMHWMSNDGLTASRILIRNFYDFFSKSLGKKFYISMPERDFLMMHRIGGNVENLKKSNKEIYQKSSHPICDRLILVDNGKFSYVI